MMMTMTRFLMMSVFAIGLSACGGGNDAKAPAADTASKPAASADTSKTWRVAIEPIYPPYVMPNETKSSFSGYDIDVLNAIAEREKVTVTYTPYPWDGLFERLNTGEADIIAGGLSPNEERQLKMDFTIPYDDTTVVLAVPKDSPIKSFSDAKGKHVAYQKDSSDAKLWEKTQGTPLSPNHATDSAWLSLRAVINTKETQAEASLGHSAVFSHYLKQYPDANIKLIENPTATHEPMAFAVKKGNQELLDKLNKHLEVMKADGSLAKLHEKWIDHEHQH